MANAQYRFPRVRHDGFVHADRHERFGYPFRPGKSMLALYVDDPAGFVDALGAAIARQLPKYA